MRDLGHPKVVPGLRDIRLGPHTMQKKHLITIFCFAVAGCDFLAVNHWPQYAGAIEMTLYTIMVFGAPVMHFWSERNRNAFWIIMTFAMIVHGVFLYIIRTTFPFRSVWIVVPIALIEATGIFVVMDKALGDRSTERPNNGPTDLTL